jgi:hypothetical protein
MNLYVTAASTLLDRVRVLCMVYDIHDYNLPCVCNLVHVLPVGRCLPLHPRDGLLYIRFDLFTPLDESLPDIRAYSSLIRVEAAYTHNDTSAGLRSVVRQRLVGFLGGSLGMRKEGRTNSSAVKGRVDEEKIDLKKRLIKGMSMKRVNLPRPDDIPHLRPLDRSS